MKLASRQRFDAILAPILAARNWLKLRSQRERILLLIASLGLAAWATLQLIVLPIDAWRELQEREAHAWESRLNWLKHQPRTQSPAELRPGLLTSSLPNCGLQLLRVNQEGANVLVAIQEQSFECVLDWLIQLEREHAIQADQLRFQAGSREGGVTGTLRFSEN